MITSIPNFYRPTVTLLHFYVNYLSILYFQFQIYFILQELWASVITSFFVLLHFWRNTKTCPSNSEDLESAQPTSRELIPTLRRKIPLSQIPEKYLRPTSNNNNNNNNNNKKKKNSLACRVVAAFLPKCIDTWYFYIKASSRSYQ